MSLKTVQMIIKAIQIFRRFWWNNFNPFTRWVIVFIIPPIIITWIFLSPQLFPIQIPIPGDEFKLGEISGFENIKQVDSPLDDLATALLGAPIKLNWYQLCVRNRNKLKVNGIFVEVPFTHDPESGNMEIQVNHVDGKLDRIFAGIDSKNEECDKFKMGDLFDEASTSVVYRRPNPSHVPLILRSVEETKDGLDITLGTSVYIHPEDSYIEFSHVFNEVVMKFMIILFSWIIILNSFLESLNSKLIKEDGS